jgi:hypothetical protein
MKYWTIIEISYTGEESEAHKARMAVHAAIAEVVNIEEHFPDVSLGGERSGRIGTLAATVEAACPLEAVTFMVETFRSAVEASGQGGGWDMPGAVFRVAPAEEALRAYQPVGDGPLILPSGYMTGDR